MPSVIDFGADPTGNTNSNSAFAAAFAAHPGKNISIPAGTYLVGAAALKLDAAGSRWTGASKYSTIIKAASGTTGSLCEGTGSATGTAAFCGIENLQFDLNGENCTAVDLASINNSVVRDCFFRGGMGFGQASTTSGSPTVNLTGTDGENTQRLRVGQTVFGPNLPVGTTIIAVNSGTQFTMSANATSTTMSASIAAVAGNGVRCAAPLSKGAYTNQIQDCAALHVERAFISEDGANENTFTNCEAIASAVGFQVENGVDTIRIFGGRSEGCLIGLQTGGRETIAVGVRFENNATTDVEFRPGADRPSLIACHSASSATTLLNEHNCTGIYSRGGSFPQRDIEPNISNAVLHAARATFAGAGVAPTTSAAATDYAIFFQGYPLLGHQVALESENRNGGSPNNRVIIAYVDNQDDVIIPAYRRANGSYGNVILSEVLSARPAGLFYAGTKVVGAQGAGVADATNGTTIDVQARAAINAVLARLRDHGLIAP